MASETTFVHWKVFFFMRKREKKGPNSKFPRCPIFNFFVVIREVILQKMAPILDPVNFFFGFDPFGPLCLFKLFLAYS